MDRGKFNDLYASVYGMNKTSAYCNSVCEEYCKQMLNKQSDYFTEFIIVEELGELQKEILKWLRACVEGEDLDITGILEEIADVRISLEYIKQLFDFSDKEFDDAMLAKIMYNYSE